MSDFTRKNPVDLEILRKQILAEARQYTDASIEDAIESLLDKDQISSDSDEIEVDPDVEDLIPTPDGSKNPGAIESIKFLNDSGEFDYDEDFAYGNLYISSDGEYVVDVTAKAISTNKEMSSIEVQITRIDNAG
jgi:hypothetical protein